jgi:acetyl-CoA C-acetyltransferase
VESLDPRTPVLVGCGQVVQRKGELARAREPLALMHEALERAAEDAGAPGLLPAADSIRVPRGLWEYANPAAWLAERIGAGAPETALGPISGSTVQRMLSDAAREIAAGRRDLVLLTGAECEHSKRRARASGAPLEWSECKGVPDQTFGSHDPGFGPIEQRYRIRPVQAFSLFENALRQPLGESPEAARTHISELWAGFARIAADNPYAWIRDAPDALTIRTPAASNRMIAYPYTKLLVANMVVDMGAALILCSVEAARRHGVSDDRFVFLHAATDVLATPPLTDRRDLCDRTGIGVAGRRALELAGVAPEELAEVDLYSCFPSAVRIAARELGLPLGRELSVTGGLTFGGGPFNSYVLHSIATLMGRLRGRPEARGLATGIGGYMAKHAAAVYGAAPPAAGFAYADCTEQALAAPTRRFVADFEGPVRVESFAQMPGRDRDDFLLVACLTDEGSRTFATFADARAPEALESEELCGRTGRIRAGELRC